MDAETLGAGDRCSSAHGCGIICCSVVVEYAAEVAGADALRVGGEEERAAALGHRLAIAVEIRAGDGARAADADVVRAVLALAAASVVDEEVEKPSWKMMSDASDSRAVAMERRACWARAQGRCAGRAG